VNSQADKILFEEEHNNYYYYKPNWSFITVGVFWFTLLLFWIYELINYKNPNPLFNAIIILSSVYYLSSIFGSIYLGRLIEVRVDGIYIISHFKRRIRDYVPFNNISKYYIETILRHPRPIVYRNQYGEKRNYSGGVHHIRIEYSNGDVVLLNPKDNEKLLEAINQAIQLRKSGGNTSE